jgi:hypothetical protein
MFKFAAQGGLAGNYSGTYGSGVWGFNYSVSGGTKGIQLEGMAVVDGIALKGSYATGYQDTSSNLSLQVGLGAIQGSGQATHALPMCSEINIENSLRIPACPSEFSRLV